MALYAFDGTWNKKKDGEDPEYTNTNVARFHAAYQQNSGRPEFYVAGVGTRHKTIGKILGGVFGLGEQRKQLLKMFRRERGLVGCKLSQIVGGSFDQSRPFLSGSDRDHEQIAQVFDHVGAVGAQIVSSLDQL